MLTRISSVDLPRLVQRLTVVASQISIRNKTSTKRVALQILDDSLNLPPCAPRDTGDLRKTARVEGTDQGHAVVYGGSGGLKYVDYAELVHDDLRPRKYKLAGSGPKFVETHVLRRAPEGMAIVNKGIQDLLNEVK